MQKGDVLLFEAEKGECPLFLKSAEMATMVNPPRRYAPVGFCVYCGARGVPLGREHIVPYGLGGTMILPDASCKKCEAITGAIEQQCLRRILGDLRKWRGIGGRKHKDTYKPKPMLIEVDGRVEMFDVVVPEKRLDFTCLHALPEPTILRGHPPLSIVTWPLDWVWVNAALGKEAQQAALEGTPNAQRVYVQADFHPEIFSKMLAKIGHAFAVAELGLDRFKPLLPNAILAKEPWFPCYLVGGDPTPVQASEYSNEVGLRRSNSATGQQYLIARIRLFGDLVDRH